MQLIQWLRERLAQVIIATESVIVTAVGFEVINWTEIQVGLVMAAVANVLGVIVYSDQKSLREQVGLYQYSAALEHDEHDIGYDEHDGHGV